jgi:hypothetical protein
LQIISPLPRTIKNSGGIPAAEGETVMTEDLQTSPVLATAEASTSTNPAVTHCCNAYARAHQAARARGKGQIFAALAANKAFRNAMPVLVGYENIRDFIACTAHGILLDAINGEQATKLLSAARVALTGVRYLPTPEKSAH